jgi:hypothetical protein
MTSSLNEVTPERGHRLADPDQQKSLCLCWLYQDSSLARRVRCSHFLRALGFRFGGDGVVTDPRQSPFWIKALGLPGKGKTPGPWLRAAPEIPRFPAMAKCCRSLFSEAARERWTRFVHRERAATGAIAVHRSLAPVRGQVQPLAGFMTEAHQCKIAASRDSWRDAAAAKSVLLVVSQPRDELTAAAQCLPVHANARLTSNGT